MTKDRHPGKSKEPPAADPFSPEELDDLAAFCTSVVMEDISFENWCQHHSKLDLQFPITISRAQLTQAFKTIIRLSRSIRITHASGPCEKREKFEHEVVLDPKDELPKVIVVPGLGDRLDSQVGDLRIIIRLKD